MTDFENLSLERAVQLFEGWGFLVKPGPRAEEVTLILEGPAHRSYYVHEAAHLPRMAAAVLRARWCTGVIGASMLEVQREAKVLAQDAGLHRSSS